MYIAICDDEEESINQLEVYMQKISKHINNVKWKSFSSAEAFLEEYRKDASKYDVLITDIEMKEMNGIELANTIRESNRNIIIFFITNHTNYAIECFRPEPMNFFEKPVDYSVLEYDIRRAAKRINQASDYITVIENRYPVRIRIIDIRYVEKRERKTIIHTVDGDYRVNKPISEIHNQLPQAMFVKVYTSYVVNLAYIKKICDKEILINGVSDIIPVSRNYIGQIRKQFILFKERRFFRNDSI